MAIIWGGMGENFFSGAQWMLNTKTKKKKKKKKKNWNFFFFKKNGLFLVKKKSSTDLAQKKQSLFGQNAIKGEGHYRGRNGRKLF